MMETQELVAEFELKELNLYGDGGIESDTQALKRFLEASNKLLEMNPLLATLRLSEQFSVRRLKAYVLLIKYKKIRFDKKDRPVWNQEN